MADEERAPITPDTAPGTPQSDPGQAPSGSTPSGELRTADQSPASMDAEGEAAKAEVGTDLSEIAQARRSATDKTSETESRAAHAADAAEGVAGTDMDDETAAAVEATHPPVAQQSRPGAAPAGAGSADDPRPTPPAAPPRQTGDDAPAGSSLAGGSTGAPAERNPSGTGTPTVSESGRAGDAAPSEPAGGTATNRAESQADGDAGGAAGAMARAAGATSAPARPAGAAQAPARPAGPADGATKPAGPAAGARPAGGAAKAAGPAVPAKPGAPAKPGGPAAPAKPAPPPEPDPDELAALKEVVPDLTWERRHGYVEVKVPREKLVPMARRLKELGFDYLSAITGVDWRDRLEVLYHVYSYDYVAHPGCIVLRVDLPPEPSPLCPSLTPVWWGADFQEREVYDLMGIRFIGHPDLRRILTEDNFPGHPLRKDWTFDYEYVLVRHLRHGAEGQAGPPGGEEGYRRV